MRRLMITIAVIGFSGAAWAQNIGIGTSTPAALLHVNGTGTGQGNTLFTGQYKSSNPGNPPASGQGTRMMWYPDKAAFRAGYVSGDQWDAGNIGDYSVAIGFGTRASGRNSVAMGNASTASGLDAIAIGPHTLSSAYASAAFGIWNVGSGSPASWVDTDPIFEIGNGSSALARANAFTVLKNGNIGIGTATPGSSLEVAGQIKLSGGTPGTGKVLTSDANGLASWQTPAPDGLALPYSNTVTYNLQAFKVVNTEGVGIRSEGHTGVVGISHTAQGSGVLGSYPNASGLGCGVFARNASSEGYGLLAESWSESGVTYGVYSKVTSPFGTGIYGEALATTGNSIGVYGRSFASGGTGVYGSGHFALQGYTQQEFGTGLYVSSHYPSGLTRGVYSSVTSPDGYSGYFTGGSFYVNGNVGINESAPDYRLVVRAASTASTGIAAFRNSMGENKVVLRQNSDGSGAVHVYNAENITSILLRGSGGDSYINSGNVGIGTIDPAYRLQVGVAGDGTQARANAWNTLSDARFKKDFEPLEDPLGMVERMTGYYYHWNTGSDSKRQIGFSAQELQQVLPEVVSAGADGYLGVDYGKLTTLLVEAVKSLKQENELLRARLEKLEKIILQKQ